MKKIQNLYKAAMRCTFGYEFMCWHDNADGSRNVFHCTTYKDAIEWAACALNCSHVTIMDRSGYLVSKRFAIV